MKHEEIRRRLTISRCNTSHPAMNNDLEKRNEADVIIRLATFSDAPMLAKFRYAFRSGTGSVRENETEFVERCTLWMQERLGEASAWTCWIAEQEDAPVGHLWAQLIEKIPNPSPEPERHAYLTNFYVCEDTRGHGIGSRLLSAALDWCRGHEVHAVILWPTERSRSLYLRHGFSVRADLLELLIESR
ncbi:MAG: GNAT family N-acetyltransferase [Pyrinomonadaceae bacterium]